MNRTSSLSTVIDAQLKKAILSFCEKHGIKLRYLIEQALLEQLEDEIDLETYRSKSNEETISLEQILAKRHKKKR